MVVVYLLGAAFLLWAAFPPLNIGLLAWVALIPLFEALDRAPSLRAAFGRAYLAGFLFFVSVLFWIHYVSAFGDWLAWLGLILLSAYLALYVGIFGLAYFSFRSTSWSFFLIPASWTVLEYGRGTFLTGFNWGALGHTQTGTLLLSLGSVTGVAGLSFIVVLGNLLIRDVIVELVRLRRPGVAFGTLAAAGGGVILLAGLVSWQAAPATRYMSAAVIQPSTSLDDAWDPSKKGAIVHHLLALSRQALGDNALVRPAFIVWPETAFPAFYDEPPALFNEVRAFARVNQVPLLIGTIKRQNGKYYNAAILIDVDGTERTWVAKRHLVLFGEYIPFRKEFPFLSALAPIDDFSSGPQEALITLPNGVKAGVLLCFEDTVPYLARRYAARGADILINMTNDAWFHDSGQQRMHLNNALFRAAENGLSLVRATNTGESCFVGRDGRVEHCIAGPDGKRVGAAGAMTSVVAAGRACPTFYTKYGEIFTGACFTAILISLIFFYGRRRMRCEQKQP